MELLGFIRCKSIATALKGRTYKTWSAVFQKLRWCNKPICLFMSSSFSEIKAVSSFPKRKNSTPDRMKQRLERRMLRDRCKAFICDHLFQELPQDANNYLQNSHGEAQHPKRFFGYVFWFPVIPSQDLIECLGVIQWALVTSCCLYIHIIWSDKVKKSPTHNELECDLLLVDW